MAGINKVIIVGNLGGEPELKSIGNNKFVKTNL
jgi:single-stranded DNA-binding protein